ncbi:MAG: hypothetical protein K2X38_02390 [Gemmataceae bacterium]|nr:hypothetical protein [Gemmataceae bacterium]
MARRDDELDTSPPTNDAFTGMLAISLIALIVGAALLYLDWQQYPESTPKKPIPKAPGAVLQPAADGGAKKPPADDGAKKPADDGAKKVDDLKKADDAAKKDDEPKKDA